MILGIFEIGAECFNCSYATETYEAVNALQKSGF